MAAPVDAYFDRPGLSPVNAGLVASGLIALGDRVLAVGCGNAEEAASLAELGISVVGCHNRPAHGVAIHAVA